MNTQGFMDPVRTRYGEIESRGYVLAHIGHKKPGKQGSVLREARHQEATLMSTWESTVFWAIHSGSEAVL